MMASGDQRFGQQAAAAAKLEHEAIAGEHGHEHVDDPRSASGSVEPKRLVVPNARSYRIVSVSPGDRLQSSQLALTLTRRT